MKKGHPQSAKDQKRTRFVRAAIAVFCLFVFCYPSVSAAAFRAANKKELAACRQHHKVYLDDLMQRARQIAAQCETYLDAHPGLEPQAFELDYHFAPIAVQKVGDTGFSFLMACGDKTPDAGKLTVYAHPRFEVTNRPLDVLLKMAGPYAPDYKAIIKAANGCKTASGFYIWNEGIEGVKAMALAPVNGYPYMIGCEIYVAEYENKKSNASVAAAPPKPDKTAVFSQKIDEQYFGIPFGGSPETVKKILQSASPPVKLTKKTTIKDTMQFICPGHPQIKDAAKTRFSFCRNRLYEINIEFTGTSDPVKKALDTLKQSIETRYGKMMTQYDPITGDPYFFLVSGDLMFEISYHGLSGDGMPYMNVIHVPLWKAATDADDL